MHKRTPKSHNLVVRTKAITSKIAQISFKGFLIDYCHRRLCKQSITEPMPYHNVHAQCKHRGRYHRWSASPGMLYEFFALLWWLECQQRQHSYLEHPTYRPTDAHSSHCYKSLIWMKKLMNEWSSINVTLLYQRCNKRP